MPWWMAPPGPGHVHGDRSSGDHRPERLLGPGEVHTLARGEGDGPSRQHTHVPPAPVPGGREFRAIGLRTSVRKRGQGDGSERRLPGTGAGQTLGRRSGQDLLHGRGERPFEGGGGAALHPFRYDQLQPVRRVSGKGEESGRQEGAERKRGRRRPRLRPRRTGNPSSRSRGTPRITVPISSRSSSSCS